MKTTNKSFLSLLGCLLGLSVAGSVQANSIVSIKVMDVGTTVTADGGVCNGVDNSGCMYDSTLDGKSGGFAFSAINPLTFQGTSEWTGDVGDGTVDLSAANATGSFTTGFIFLNAPFVPFTSGPSVGDITGTTMTWDNFSFGGNYNNGVDFFLDMDPGSMMVNWVVATDDPNEFLVQFQFAHLITPEESASFAGFHTRWLIEGIATTSAVPVPAAAWLFGSGLIGLIGVARRKSIQASTV